LIVVFLSQIAASHDNNMCAAGACGVMASAGRSGTRRATSGLGAGFGHERNLPYPKADAGRLMISGLPARVGSARALERAVLSATMAASSAKRTSRWLTKLVRPGSLAWAEAAWHVELDLPTGPSANYPMFSI